MSVEFIQSMDRIESTLLKLVENTGRIAAALESIDQELTITEHSTVPDRAGETFADVMYHGLRHAGK
jgi:hypothetical protein